MSVSGWALAETAREGPVGAGRYGARMHPPKEVSR